MDNAKVIGALAMLAPSNDDHWVQNGDPRLDVMEELIGEPITRKQLAEIQPEGFTRNTAADFWADAAEPEEEVEEVEEPDAIALIEAFVAAVQTDRFRRNSELQALARQWMVQQTNARVLQERLDQRMNARKAAKD